MIITFDKNVSQKKYGISFDLILLTLNNIEILIHSQNIATVYEIQNRFHRVIIIKFRHYFLQKIKDVIMLQEYDDEGIDI